ncbi:MAG TPA: hypothetical protein VLF94_08590 [Chlamydiales bacterium]|nr:hypothetical protein [Chlamydiales bacterium]
MQVPAKVIEEMNKLTLTEEGGVQGNPSQLKKYTKLCQAAFVMTQMIKRPPPGINKTNGHHGNYTIRTVR